MKKYLPNLVLSLLFISVLTSIIDFISTESEFWTIATCVSLGIAIYLLFKLTECRVFLVLFFFNLLYFGNEVLNDYGLAVGDVWKNIISVAKWILIILLVVVYLKERKILLKKLKDILSKNNVRQTMNINHDIQLNKLTKREILMIIVTILLTIIVIIGLIEYANFTTTRELRPIPLIILGALLFILIIIAVILRKYYKQSI